MYYEIEFGSFDDNNVLTDDTYSICIKGNRKPTIKEAAEFCKEDLKIVGYDAVISVDEISHEEAIHFYDMENEEKFPVFW